MSLPGARGVRRASPPRPAPPRQRRCALRQPRAGGTLPSPLHPHLLHRRQQRPAALRPAPSPRPWSWPGRARGPRRTARAVARRRRFGAPQSLGTPAGRSDWRSRPSSPAPSTTRRRAASTRRTPASCRGRGVCGPRCRTRCRPTPRITPSSPATAPATSGSTTANSPPTPSWALSSVWPCVTARRSRRRVPRGRIPPTFDPEDVHAAPPLPTSLTDGQLLEPHGVGCLRLVSGPSQRVTFLPTRGLDADGRIRQDTGPRPPAGT